MQNPCSICWIEFRPDVHMKNFTSPQLVATPPNKKSLFRLLSFFRRQPTSPKPKSAIQMLNLPHPALGTRQLINLGFKDMTPIMENQMEKKMEDEMETGRARGANITKHGSYTSY